MAAFVALVRKDLLIWLSSRRGVVMGLVAPVLIAAFFGYLFDSGRNKPSRIPVAITDLDGTSLSKAVVAGLSGDDALEMRALPEPEAVREVNRGDVRAAIVLPQGLGESAPGALFGNGTRAQITVRYDPSQSMTLAVVRGLLAQHVMTAVGQSVFGLVDDEHWLEDLQRGVAEDPHISADLRKELIDLFGNIKRLQLREARASKEGRAVPQFRLPYETLEVSAAAGVSQTYNSYAHSFAGMGVQFVLFTGIEFGVGVLLARRTGVWQRMRAAPVSRATLLGSRIASAAVIAFLLLLAVIACGMLFFGVRIEGSVAGLLGLALSFSLLTGAFGLLIAALGVTPEATRSLAIVVTLAMVMLGGAWVPAFVFPQWLQEVSLAVPTRWAVDGLDAVIWRGQGFAAVAPAIGVLCAFALAFTVLAIWRFRWDER